MSDFPNLVTANAECSAKRCLALPVLKSSNYLLNIVDAKLCVRVLCAAAIGASPFSQALLLIIGVGS